MIIMSLKTQHVKIDHGKLTRIIDTLMVAQFSVKPKPRKVLMIDIYTTCRTTVATVTTRNIAHVTVV